MKTFKLLLPLALLVSFAAFANEPTRPPYPGNPGYPGNPNPGMPGDAKGRVNRLAITLGQDAEQAAEFAKSLFEGGLYNDGIRPDEVEAVAAIIFVKDTAADFRTAVARENLYRGEPVQSRRAYLWLNHAFAAMERNALIRVESRLRPSIAKMERSMRQLRAFYSLASRLGWGLAEVVLLSQSLEKETSDVVRLASAEMDDRRELHIVRQLEAFRDEARLFNLEAQRYTTPIDAKIQLMDNFRRLQSRYTHLSNLMSDPRFARFSPRVQQAFGEVRMVYTDLEYVFISSN